MKVHPLIEASVIADTVSPAGSRITTFVISCPLHAHVQMLTHRAFSRNAQSNRAIPTKTLMATRANYVPVLWGKNKKGMSPGDVEVGSIQRAMASLVWKFHALTSKASARILLLLGVHKETTNRLLASHIMVKSIITATDYDNFYKLRAHEAAQSDIHDLALKMKAAMDSSTPRESYVHAPFATSSELSSLEEFVGTLDVVGVCSNKNKLYMYARIIFGSTTIKAITGRAARVSYLSHDNASILVNPNKDVDLHDVLLKDKHMSPFEHAAIAANPDDRHANFSGWYSYRSYLERIHSNKEDKVD